MFYQVYNKAKLSCFRINKTQPAIPLEKTLLTAESLNFWLTNFTMEVCKDSGESYPPRTLYSIISAIQRHLEDSNGTNAVKMRAGKNIHVICAPLS